MSHTLSCFSAVKRTGDSNERPSCVAPFVNAVFVGDRSGSMSAMGSVPREGAQDFMIEYQNLHKKNPQNTIDVTVWTFDDVAECPYTGKGKNITHLDIRKVGESMYPRNTTRLYDTVIDAIIAQQQEITKIRSKIGKNRMLKNLDPTIAVMFTLLTDGEDNASVNRANDMRVMIQEHQKIYGAHCFFAAANQDAMREGQRYGFSQETSLQIGNDVHEAREAFRSCTNASMRAARGLVSDYTSAEREASCAQEHNTNYSDAEDDVVDDVVGDDYYNTPRAYRC